MGFVFLLFLIFCTPPKLQQKVKTSQSTTLQLVFRTYVII
ncbi:hypothetical protein HSACCH_00745 [Halanaerobium saccharolyticum subsp. saccharolyticum DSM 6643]|uniref:Uncharacterized protein n=1 Tax=Halanaerobium saccharolyticum subsp. saccharolyticum DSM 6643 TaxID=1293054 RepID=M5DZ90_9FIRM|nr:hypothetical protein HSACCH_00745 [Halanaerobium saccharolyticum subsp. saccharolyticum DSM 6643]